MVKTKKIKCSTCVNAQAFFCTVKKVEIRPNKKHRCKQHAYSLPTKIPAKINYPEQEKVRQKYKQELVELKYLMNERATNGTNEKHPLTGNLDRFK